jgi:hypothetical protein
VGAEGLASGTNISGNGNAVWLLEAYSSGDVLLDSHLTGLSHLQPGRGDGSEQRDSQRLPTGLAEPRSPGVATANLVGPRRSRFFDLAAFYDQESRLTCQTTRQLTAIDDKMLPGHPGCFV